MVLLAHVFLSLFNVPPPPHPPACLRLLAFSIFLWVMTLSPVLTVFSWMRILEWGHRTPSLARGSLCLGVEDWWVKSCDSGWNWVGPGHSVLYPKLSLGLSNLPHPHSLLHRSTGGLGSYRLRWRRSCRRERPAIADCHWGKDWPCS